MSLVQSGYGSLPDSTKHRINIKSSKDSGKLGDNYKDRRKWNISGKDKLGPKGEAHHPKANRPRENPDLQGKSGSLGFPPQSYLSKIDGVNFGSHKRNETPSWDFDEADGRWKWMKPPPASKMPVNVLDAKERKIMQKAMKAAHSNTLREKLLKGFNCQICRQVMNLPVTTPCAHNFCKGCLEGKFVGKTQVTERSRGGRTLRAKKNIMKCPCCPTDISDFLQNVQVNREVMDVIEKLKNKEAGEASNVDEKEEKAETESEENSEITDGEDVEQPRKRAKLDTEAVVSAT